jgi:hypothetical protein
LAELSTGRFQATVESLVRRDLISIDSDRGELGLVLHLTHEGLDKGLRATVDDYSGAESRVRSLICKSAPISVQVIAEILNLSALLVEHIAREFSEQNLVSLSVFRDTIKISKPTSELCNWGQVRPRKACLVVSHLGPIHGGEFNTVKLDLRNEGEFPARDVKVMWDLGDGFPPEPDQIAIDVIPPDHQIPGPGHPIGFRLPQPAKSESGDPIPGQEKRVRLKLTFRDGMDERDEAIFTILLRSNQNMWSPVEERQSARLSPICQFARPESR